MRSIIHSGSEVNIISQKAFERLSKTQKDIPTLPVENVRLVTVFGKRSKKIKTQALIEFTLGEDEFKGIFMISPQLTNDVIFGCQLLREYSMNINFEKGTISYVRDNTNKQVEFVQEPLEDPDGNSDTFLRNC
jgi:hypothetical protein